MKLYFSRKIFNPFNVTKMCITVFVFLFLISSMKWPLQFCKGVFNSGLRLLSLWNQIQSMARQVLTHYFTASFPDSSWAIMASINKCQVMEPLPGKAPSTLLSVLVWPTMLLRENASAVGGPTMYASIPWSLAASGWKMWIVSSE